mmetsp:Transcript_55006/g.155922  ORF Transcript_55006/g.155922 Transcript_55006/m.155922 type:complete len:372 (-) Transcript_55006:126-1241(-)
MSSLSIEMGLRRKRGNSPPVPDSVASRDDVTLAQKQRLAMLAKMGLGSQSGVGGPPSIRDVPQLGGAAMRDMQSRGPSMIDRKAALLDKERRFREQEERQQEQESREEQVRLEKMAKRRGTIGMQRLGPVQPREDDIPQFLPAPMRELPPPKADSKMEIKISKETAERAKGPIVEKEEKPEEDEDEDEDDEAEDQVLAFLRFEKAKKNKVVKVLEVKTNKPAKKKRKRTRGGPGEDQDDVDDDELGGEEDGDEAYDPAQIPVRQNVSGLSKQIMVVEPVKGRVSTANRNFTDADLERRFSMQDSQGHGSLMTEEEVLRMIRKEKQEKGGANSGSASRRGQRELAEWAAAKEQQRARVKSPHRFERMVVSRK